MNIFEAQERLNRLPPSPQTLQYLSAAAEGQNPNVPPWLALVRMNEIKQEMQTAQKMGQEQQQGQQGPPPTIKDQTQQAAGIMALQQQKQQAGLQQLAQQAGQGQPIPAGGIAGVAPPQAFRGGGIVMGFQAGGYVPGEEDPLEAERRRAEAAGVVPYSEREMLDFVTRQAEDARRRQDKQNARLREEAMRPVPVPPDPNIAYRQQYAEMGVDPKAAYSEQQRRMQALEQRIQQEEATRRQEQEKAGRAGFFNSLIAAGEATRGARGSGIAQALGGYGRAQNASDAALAQQRRESEAQMLKRQADMNTLYAGLDESRMGTAGEFAKRQTGYEGDLTKGAAAGQKARLGAEMQIGEELGRAGTAATKESLGAYGRAISSQGQQSVMDRAAEAQERQRRQQELQLEIAESKRLTGVVQALEQNYNTKVPNSPEAQRLAAERKALEEVNRRIELIRQRLQGGASSAPGTPPSSGGGAGGASSGGAYPPANTAAAKFRQNFPATR